MKKHNFFCCLFSFILVFQINVFLFAEEDINTNKIIYKEIPVNVDDNNVNDNIDAEIQSANKREQPVYVSELSNINDYCLFANGGWDGNWYIGFNVCWIEELPAIPEGNYSRAFIGAKIGRMKTQSAKGKPVWEKETIPGSIYIALSSTPSWKASQTYFLVDTQDIPLEGDYENALEGVGESKWFWVEVSINTVKQNQQNYVALWSPTEYFVSTASSPILAGGWGGQKINSWMNNDVKGYPPLNSSSALKTGISVFEPAIAMKLIPEGSEQKIGVKIDSIKEGKEKTLNKTFVVSVSGDNIEKAWIEISEDGVQWVKYGKNIYNPPYMFTFKPDNFNQGQQLKIRCAVSDIWENIGYSDILDVTIEK